MYFFGLTDLLDEVILVLDSRSLLDHEFRYSCPLVNLILESYFLELLICLFYFSDVNVLGLERLT